MYSWAVTWKSHARKAIPLSPIHRHLRVATSHYAKERAWTALIAYRCPISSPPSFASAFSHIWPDSSPRLFPFATRPAGHTVWVCDHIASSVIPASDLGMGELAQSLCVSRSLCSHRLPQPQDHPNLSAQSRSLNAREKVVALSHQSSHFFERYQDLCTRITPA